MVQIAIPDDWDGESTCRWAVCWPDSPKWKAILYGLLEAPAQGRTWDFRTGNFLALRSQFKPIYDYNFSLKECFMACNDVGLTDIAAAISAMASAVNNISIAITNNQNNGCCDKQGSSGAGTVQPPFSSIEQGQPAIDPPPTGFETWDEFLSDKCAIAHDIVSKLKSDLGNMAIIQFASFDVGALAALIAVIIATPIPFDDLLALAGLLLSVAATIVIASTLDIININEEELVCVLYNAPNSSSATSAFNAKFSDFADTYFSDPIEKFASKALVNYFVDAGVTNQLFIKNTAVTYPASDCSTCIEETLEVIRFDTPAWTEDATVIAGNLVYDEWILIESGLGYWGGNPTWLIANVEIKTIDNSVHTWDVEYVSGGGPHYQSAHHDSGGYGDWTGWGTSTNFNWTAQSGLGMGFESGDASNPANPPNSKFRIRVRCNS